MSLKIHETKIVLTDSPSRREQPPDNSKINENVTEKYMKLKLCGLTVFLEGSLQSDNSKINENVTEK